MNNHDTHPPTPNHPTAKHDHDEDEASDVPALRAQLERLREENTRLRDEYSRAKQASYRKTALGLATIGLLALLGALLLPGVRDILLVLGAIGVFSGLLTRYLTPERVVTIDVGESVYDAHAATIQALIDELGLQDTHIYLPTDPHVRLFIPKHPDPTLPHTTSDATTDTATDLDGPRETTPPDAADAVDANALFITPDAARGVTLQPSARGLITDLTTTHPQQDEALRPVIQTTADALVEQFEVADAVTIRDAATDPTDRVVIGVTNPAFGDLDTPDHPLVSALATNAAHTLNTPIATDVITQDDERVIVCQQHPPDTTDHDP